MTPSSRRTSLARKPWQERRVQWVAALPSFAGDLSERIAEHGLDGP